VHTAYALIKLLGVALMTAAIFPAYFLARLVVSRPYAIFAAVGAVAAPALSYSPFLVDEPLAYPAATLAFLLIARAAVRPTLLTLGLALGSCYLGFHVRTQLAILFPVLGLVLLARSGEPRAPGAGVRRGRRGTGSGQPCSWSGSRSSSQLRSDAGRSPGTWRRDS
jgi:hypothetical protein